MYSNINLNKIKDDFQPEKYKLSKDKQNWQEISIFQKLYRKMVDCFDSKSKWIRSAHAIDTYCRNKLENSRDMDLDEYKALLIISKQVRRKLKSQHTSKSSIQARSLLKRQNVALKMRSNCPKLKFAPLKKEDPQITLLQHKIVESLKSERHFWCVDFHHTGLDNDTPAWFNEKWQEVRSEIKKHAGLRNLLLEHPEQLEDFINWTFRDNCPVDVFAGFPTIVDTLKPLYCAGRIGRASEFSKGSRLLNVKRTASGCYVTLPVETGNNLYECVPLLPKQAITLRNGVQLKLQDLAKGLIRRYDDYIPDFQFTSQGLRLFHTHQVAIASDKPDAGKSFPVLEPIKATKAEEWWNAIPSYEEISPEEAEKRCRGLGVDKTSFLILHGAVENGGCDAIGTHGYIEVGIKNADNGNYKIYSFGKTAKQAPHGLLEEVTFLTKTVLGRICVGPDQNEELSNRQNWGVSFAMDQEQLNTLKEAVFTEVEKGHKDQLSFSLMGKNCHSFTFKMAKKVLGQEHQEALEKLHILNWKDPLFAQGSSQPFIAKLMSHCKGKATDNEKKIQERTKKVLAYLGGKRKLVINKGDRAKKEICICNSKRAFEKNYSGTYMPPKIRHLIMDHKQPIHIVRNRVYCSDGFALLTAISKKDGPAEGSIQENKTIEPKPIRRDTR